MYIGITRNIEQRIKDHNRSKTKSTKSYGPWQLFYKEFAENRLLARRREKELKSGSGREFLKEILKGAYSSSG